MDWYEINTHDVINLVSRCSFIPMGPVNGAHDMRRSFDDLVEVLTIHEEDNSDGINHLLEKVRKIRDLDRGVDWGAVCDAYKGSRRAPRAVEDDGMNAYISIGIPREGEYIHLVKLDKTYAVQAMGDMLAHPIERVYRVNHLGLNIVID